MAERKYPDMTNLFEAMDARKQARAREKFEKDFEKVCQDLERQIESSRDSERLTAEDFNIRINCVPD